MPTAKQFEVFIDDGEVWIGQSDDGSERQDIVRLHPEQIPLLIKWLAQAAKLANSSEPKAG
ncbi:hypothetical protein [Herbaspirillum sp. AP21]|uniref:hypothetical protein n=1 Tax=Herbaspirillum sp. AP21 TaxID=2754073 RepID=UPI0015DA87E0|nr:hypothetical protein [Herbaspirillum sp. AP21]NZD66612.1 hypothetical protein [Herbaspirillum sp. AP21]